MAEPLYQAGYIERYGTGEIFHLTTEAGLKAPEIILDEGFKVIIWTFAITDHVTGQVEDVIRRVLLVFNEEIPPSPLFQRGELPKKGIP